MGKSLLVEKILGKILTFFMQSSLFASVSICYDVCLSQRTLKKHNVIRMVTKHDIFFKSNIYLSTKVKENIFSMKNRVIFYIFNYSTRNVLLLYSTLCYVHLFILYSEEFRSHFFFRVFILVSMKLLVHMLLLIYGIL